MVSDLVESIELPETDLAYLRDAYLQNFDATVVAVDCDGRRIALEQTYFYPTGGGQPHDTGTIRAGLIHFSVFDVRKDGVGVWHSISAKDGAAGPDAPLPAVGDVVTCTIEWERRHKLMRTHTVLHILCGVIWNRWGVAVTGGNMEPLSARMDFEFDPLPEGFAEEVERLVNAEIAADRPIEVSFLANAAAQTDPDLIRTKVNMIPAHVTEIRVVDIVGLDKQADGGTHVASTGEVGGFRVVKTESKGKGNKRLRIEVLQPS